LHALPSLIAVTVITDLVPAFCHVLIAALEFFALADDLPQSALTRFT